MGAANLLIHIESFCWHELETNRASELDSLAVAVIHASNNQDIIYSHPDTFFIALPWGNLYEILTYDEEKRRSDCPWLSHDHQKTLIKLFSHSTSKKPSYDLRDLDQEFLNGINGMLSADHENRERYVFNHTSLKSLYAFYTKQIQVSPQLNLNVNGNYINMLIKKAQTHPFFKRLDIPKQDKLGASLHGEQIQMHFNDKANSCLNIDGSWKHGYCKIPQEAKEILNSWGFLIPN